MGGDREGSQGGEERTIEEGDERGREWIEGGSPRPQQNIPSEYGPVISTGLPEGGLDMGGQPVSRDAANNPKPTEFPL